MSNKSRKFIYSIAMEGEPTIDMLRKINSKYQIFIQQNNEIHGFIYLNSACKVETMQRKLNSENVYDTTDDMDDIVNDLKTKADSCWECGSLRKSKSVHEPPKSEPTNEPSEPATKKRVTLTNDDFIELYKRHLYSLAENVVLQKRYDSLLESYEELKKQVESK